VSRLLNFIVRAVAKSNAFAKRILMKLRCAKCGSEKVIPLIGIEDQGINSDGTLRALVGYSNPEAWLFKGEVYARLHATICGQCGYTELTAHDPAALYAAYLKSKETKPKTKAGEDEGEKTS
jgi:hypothetical protein